MACSLPFFWMKFECKAVMLIGLHVVLSHGNWWCRCHRDYVAHKGKDVYYLAPYKKACRPCSRGNYEAVTFVCSKTSLSCPSLYFLNGQVSPPSTLCPSQENVHPAGITVLATVQRGILEEDEGTVWASEVCGSVASESSEKLFENIDCVERAQELERGGPGLCSGQCSPTCQILSSVRAVGECEPHCGQTAFS